MSRSTARHADLLECFLQGCEHRDEGLAAADAWIESCRSELTTALAKRLAAACLRLGPKSWRT